MTALAALGRVALHAARHAWPGLVAPAAPAGARGRARALDLRRAVAADAGARGPRPARGPGFPHAHVLVAAPGVARGSRRAAARVRRAAVALRARPLFEGREPLLSCLYLGVATLSLAVLGARRAPAASRAARRWGPRCFLLLSLGRHTPLYAAAARAAGLRPAALSAEVPAAGVAVRGAAGGARRSGPGPRLERGRAPSRRACSRPLCWRSRSRRSPPRPRLPEAARTVRSRRSSSGAARCCWRSACLLLARRSAGGAARPGCPAAFLLLGGHRPGARGTRHEPGRPGRALRAAARRARSARAAAAGRVHAATESAACLAPGEGPAGWEPARRGGPRLPGHAAAARGRSAGACSAATTASSRASVRASRAAFTEVVHARTRDSRRGCACSSSAASSTCCYLGHSRAGRASSRSRRSRRRTPVRCSCCACPTRCPGAYVVGRELAERGDALASVVAPGLRPAPRGAASPAARPRRGSRAFPRRRASCRATADTLAGRGADLARPGVLVVTEAFDDGWSAEVDGRPAEVLRANGLFRAVRLGAGRHEVRFRYRPWSVRAGALRVGAGARRRRSRSRCGAAAGARIEPRAARR